MNEEPERFVSSPSTEIVKALAAALPEIANPSKDGKSHHGKYLTLPAILDHVKPILAAHGLAVMQTAAMYDNTAGCTTTLVHDTGEIYRCGTLRLPAGEGPQNAGSAITYARRYALLSIFGISGDDDDAVTVQASYNKPSPRGKRAANPKPISARQLKAIQTAFSNDGVSEREERHKMIVKVIGREVSSTKDLTMREANAVLAAQEGNNI
jgi:hypothetical protein